MDPDALERAVADDRARGHAPDVRRRDGRYDWTDVDRPRCRIADVARKHGVWLHVDAAYAGPAAIVPEFRWLLDGCDRADTLVLNPHKWLFVPIDLSVLYARDLEMVRRAFTLIGRLPGNARDRRSQLHGLRAAAGAPLPRAEAVVRAARATAPRRSVTSCGGTSRSRRSWRAGSKPSRGWEMAAPHPLSVVCFRYAPDGGR